MSWFQDLWITSIAFFWVGWGYYDGAQDRTGWMLADVLLAGIFFTEFLRNHDRVTARRKRDDLR